MFVGIYHAIKQDFYTRNAKEAVTYLIKNFWKGEFGG